MILINACAHPLRTDQKGFLQCFSQSFSRNRQPILNLCWNRKGDMVSTATFEMLLSQDKRKLSPLLQGEPQQTQKSYLDLCPLSQW